MKRDLFAEDSLKKNGVHIVREGLAVARFNVALAGGAIEGAAPIALAAPDDNAGLSAEEFLVKPWRVLSSAVTPYRFFDFTKEGVLKASAPLFSGLTVYANHDADVNQWKGYTKDAVWDEKHTPPGINTLMVIDRTVDANLARGVEIGALKSASVTIWFEYEKSHPDLRYYYDHIGTVVDGQVVRFIVTKISRAAEVSIVWEGEDPFAKALGAQMAAGEDNHLEPEGGEEMKFAQAFLNQLGIAQGAEVTGELLEAKVQEKITGLQTRIDELSPDAAIGKKHLDATRKRAATLYKGIKGERFRQEYIDNVILRADLDTALALCGEYEDQVDKAAPLKCPKCGEKLSRRASQAAGDDTVPAGRRVEDYKL